MRVSDSQAAYNSDIMQVRRLPNGRDKWLSISTGECWSTLAPAREPNDAFKDDEYYFDVISPCRLEKLWPTINTK